MFGNLVYIISFLLVTHEFILINEEFFVVCSFILCFTFLFSNLADSISLYQQQKIAEINKLFSDLFIRRLEALKLQKVNLLNYKKFLLFYTEIISFVLNVIDSKIGILNKKFPLFVDFHFRVLLDQLVLSYISYVEKLTRVFVKTAHHYFYLKLAKPLFTVRQQGHFKFSHIDIFKYALLEEDSRRNIFWKEIHPSRMFLAVPAHKNAVWATLIKNKKVRIWFALYLRNSLLFF